MFRLQCEIVSENLSVFEQENLPQRAIFPSPKAQNLVRPSVGTKFAKINALISLVMLIESMH